MSGSSTASVIEPTSHRVVQPASLSVLFAVRDDLERYPGGDTVQIFKTAESLQTLGVRIAITRDPRMDMKPYDCVHLWHLERIHETLIFWYQAKAASKPIILSPIYWPGQIRRMQPWKRAWIENTQNLYRFLTATTANERRAIFMALCQGWRRGRRLLLEGVQILLPNSEAEAERLKLESRERVPTLIVRNASDVFDCTAVQAESAPIRKCQILSVGHFDPRKNQLELIRAMNELKEPITLIGGPRHQHKHYLKRCMNEAGSHVEFLGRLPHLDVLRAMWHSKIHVCSSFYETPGLANLEAARMGCTLVVPDCPPVREYFGESAFYFAPGKKGSLRSQIEAALHNNSNESRYDALETIAPFTWQEAARRTLEAYQCVVGYKSAGHAL